MTDTLVNNDGLIDLLREHVVEFSFMKKDGTLRTVKATLNPDYIPEEHRPNGRGGAYNSNQLRFFEVDLQEWRSCLKTNIVREE